MPVRASGAAQGVFLAQQAEALLDAQRVDAGPGGDHRAAAVEGAVLVDGGVVHALAWAWAPAWGAMKRRSLSGQPISW